MMGFLRSWITRVASAWGYFYSWCSTRIDGLYNVLAANRADPDAAFDANADWAIAEETPKGARVLVWASAAAIFVLLVWANFAVLDEVTRGEGKVIPSRQVQVLQSMDGGIVSYTL